MMKKLSIVAFTLLLVGIIGSILTINTQVKQAEMLEEKTVGTNDFNDIEIYTSNAEITILPSDDENTRIELFGNYSNYKMEADVEGDTLIISAKTKRNKLFSFDVFSKSLSLTVYIPQKVYDNINVNSNNGKLKIKEIEGNDIQLVTDNGSIHMDNIHGQNVLLETSNGRIEIQDVVAKHVKAASDNGEIEMNHVDAAILGQTNNGKILLVTESLDHQIELHSDNGKIDIQSDNKPTNVVYDLKTQNGKITVFGENNWDAVNGSGENLIKVSSENGRITISN